MGDTQRTTSPWAWKLCALAIIAGAVALVAALMEGMWVLVALNALLLLLMTWGGWRLWQQAHR